MPVDFTHDDAGNLRTAYSIGPSYKDVYTHDAWNRLVRHEVDIDSFGLLPHAEYEYMPCTGGPSNATTGSWAALLSNA